jgi:hypothetical protein
VYKQIDLAWAAGLIEGEGYFGVIPQYLHNGERSKTADQIILTVGMHIRDREILERLQTIFGGKIYGPYGTKTHSKMLAWKIGDGYQVCHIGAWLYDWLGQRRIKQINRCFDAFFKRYKAKRGK